MAINTILYEEFHLCSILFQLYYYSTYVLFYFNFIIIPLMFYSISTLLLMYQLIFGIE